jgi:curli biogenesis system outer membrane secretion channel CsgG
MLAVLLMTGLLLQASASAQETKPAATVQATPAPSRDADGDPVSLLRVKRIFVDSFGDDAVSKELQSMIVSPLVATNQFKVTENRERADAILKGVAVEKTSQELHAYSEGTAVARRNGAAAIKDSSANTETIQEAKIAVRLVDPNGDVIWTSTQESKGAKYKGSSADAADKCVKQLLRDIDRLKNSSAPLPSTATTSAARPK